MELGYNPAFKKLSADIADAGCELLKISVLFVYKEITIVELITDDYKEMIYSLNAVTGTYTNLQ